jgi:hypothetical protein
MSGAYAHLTMVNLMRESSRLQNELRFSNDASAALLTYLRFCELGAVSPDYPYLAVGDGGAAKWADTMHWTSVGAMLKQGVAAVKTLQGEDRKKTFAWLLGYAAHVATDSTIHPVVNLKVGDYAQNKREHRICEMNQDAYIWQRMNLGNIGLSEHLTGGLVRCGTNGKVDTAVKTTWESMLRTVHAQEFAANPPKIDGWHAAFELMVDNIGEESNKLVPFARHVAVNCGLAYPNANEIDKQYIEKLAVPGGAKQHYDEIFARAMKSVGVVWIALEAAIFRDNAGALAAIRDWNLDSGKDETGKLAFWS